MLHVQHVLTRARLIESICIMAVDAYIINKPTWIISSHSNFTTVVKLRS